MGEFWAYRVRRIEEVVQVDVLKLGTQRPSRVLVRWVDETFEGCQEWVPPARLKVRWDGVDAFRAYGQMGHDALETGPSTGPLRRSSTP
ncbi:hypothetical protein [Mycobacterium lehmannii]|uniref:hypothetical protein n=1 Tax=Mycobacterium lehmannii TaxID=2048550 RepID=UPI000B94424A|nr:hypothetical protein [Mycobacterium lehmannii]